MSLRNRLVLGVLFLTAVGLFTLAIVTYTEQHSFLYQKIDQQIHSAPHAIGAGFVYQQSLHAPLTESAEAPQPATGPPVGTYGQLRDSQGKTQATILFRYGENITSVPSLPKSIPLNKVLTIGSYRVLAIPVKETSALGTSTGTIVAAIPLHDTQDTLDRLLLVESLVVLIVLLLVGSGTWLLIKRGLSPLERFAEAADEISEGDLSLRVDADEQKSEVGRLGSAFNTMLDNLEAALKKSQRSEDRLRQFVADASHELRTPLTSIRGYAELSRMGGVEDKDEVMQRIEEEAVRMGGLVNDLLTLARLDQLPEVSHADVDLREVVTKVVKDARVTSPGREITCNTEDKLIVSGDDHQLQQVISNLLRNAILHTDGAIEVTAQRGEGESIKVRVRDHGPGLPSDPNLVFERFWKGRPGSHDGAGLGLAIVSAIVSAHHGQITAENLPDGGACFTVTLSA